VPIFFRGIRSWFALYLLKRVFDLGFGLLAPLLHRNLVSPTLFHDEAVGYPNTITADRAIQESFVHVKAVIVLSVPRKSNTRGHDHLYSEPGAGAFDRVAGDFEALF
jgi:hypothetical protein